MSSPKLFNVRVDGVDVAVGLELEAARAVLAGYAGRMGSRQLYRMDRPIEGRRSFWRQSVRLRPVKRWPALSPAEYDKAMARILGREWGPGGMAGDATHELEQQEESAAA